jgi:hypothetical protein
MNNSNDLVDAVVKQGLDHEHAEKAVAAVLAALRESPTATMVFRKTEGRSVAPDARRTIFMCG